MTYLLTRVGLAAACAVATISTAFADGMPSGGSIKDAPYVAPFSWTGFYVGVNVGGQWDGSENVTTTALPTSGNSATPGGNIPEAPTSAALAANSRINASGSGLIGGGQIGYNVQAGTIVVGIEADIQALGNESNATAFRNSGPILNFPNAS